MGNDELRMTNDELRKDLFPLTYLRSVEELRCGVGTVGEHKKNIKYPWDLIVSLKEDLEEDFRGLEGKSVGKTHPSVVIYNKEKVFLEEGVEVEACAVLDARHGPIYIAKGTVIRPHAYLRGPLYIGPECRIGGEVTHSIFHGYSNKAHYGFIGHSYIGEWVNLGAGTTNSNLKNNYGTVKVTINGKEMDTGEQFMGCFIGDYAKTGIGTLITTGAVIGLGANVFGGGVTPKVVPNFSWGDKGKYRLEDFLTGVEKMMGRRGEILEATQLERLKNIFTLAA